MAQSDDVYLRKDVFDAKMEALMAEIRLGNAEIKKDIEKLDQKFEAKFNELDQKFEAKFNELDQKFEAKFNELDQKIETKFNEIDQKFEYKIEAVSNRIDAVNLRINDVQTSVYWGFSVLALLFAFLTFAPSIVDLLKNIRKPSVSLEDVERLIKQAVKPKA